MNAEEALRALDEQIAVLSAIVQETDATIKALKELKERGEALIPIGAGVMVPVKMSGEKVLVNVGGNILTENDVERAAEILEKRKASVQSALEKTRQQRMKLVEQLRRVQR